MKDFLFFLIKHYYRTVRGEILHWTDELHAFANIKYLTKSTKYCLNKQTGSHAFANHNNYRLALLGNFVYQTAKLNLDKKLGLELQMCARSITVLWLGIVSCEPSLKEELSGRVFYFADLYISVNISDVSCHSWILDEVSRSVISILLLNSFL